MRASHMFTQRITPRVGFKTELAHVLFGMLVHGALVAAAEPVHSEAEAAVLALVLAVTLLPGLVHLSRPCRRHGRRVSVPARQPVQLALRH